MFAGKVCVDFQLRDVDDAGIVSTRMPIRVWLVLLSVTALRP